MPKTYRYKKTFYSEEDIANMLGVYKENMVIRRAGLFKEYYEIVVTEREEIIENDESSGSD